MQIRPLTNSDLPAIQTLLWQHVETSLFMLGNLELVPVNFTGQRYEGQYVGAFEGDTLVALVVKYWNGNIMAQGDADAVKQVWQQSDVFRDGVNGFIGDDILCRLLRAEFEAEQREPVHYSLDSQEVLYRLTLKDIIQPSLLTNSAVELKPAQLEDLTFLISWMVGYNVETLNAEPSDALTQSIEEALKHKIAKGLIFVLWRDDQPVATSGFNAKVKHLVQIGGVWTPRDLRGQGYARACVGASLELAQSQGFTHSILFTDEGNIGARKAYESLGYECIGHFGLYLKKT